MNKTRVALSLLSLAFGFCSLLLWDGLETEPSHVGKGLLVSFMLLGCVCFSQVEPEPFHSPWACSHRSPELHLAGEPNCGRDRGQVSSRVQGQPLHARVAGVINLHILSFLD